MVLITIVTGAYKPTYNWGASHCMHVCMYVGRYVCMYVWCSVGHPPPPPPMGMGVQYRLVLLVPPSPLWPVVVSPPVACSGGRCMYVCMHVCMYVSPLI